MKKDHIVLVIALVVSTAALITSVLALRTSEQIRRDVAALAAAPVAPVDRKPEIGFVVFDYANAYVSFIRMAAQRYAENRAILHMVDSANDQARQNDQIYTFIRKGVDFLIVNPVDPGAGATILNTAKKANIPVVFINRPPPLDILNTWEKTWYIGIDWNTPGLIQSEQIKEHWLKNRAKMDRNGDGVLQYVLLQGDIVHRDAVSRTQAVTDKFAQWHRDGSMRNERLALHEAGWSTARAKDAMETWIVRFGDRIEAVVSNNDAMAMGAIEALRAHGMLDDPKRVWVYGINAIPPVWPLLEEGELAATVLTCPRVQANAAIQICIDLYNGRQPLVGTGFRFSGVAGRELRVVDRPITAETLSYAKESYIR